MFKKILAAIDGSEMSHDVFKTALDIAKADKAKTSGIRAAVAAKLAFLGVEIDSVLNSLPMTLDRDLATSQSQVRILTIHTR